MGMFDQIPHGKKDAPVLIAMRTPEVDKDDVDGAEYMLDHKLEGCFCFFCTKEIGSIDEAEATLNDEKKLPIFNGICQLGPFFETVVGVRIQPYLTEYDKDYTLFIKGILDTDGNYMAPMKYIIHTIPKSLPDSKYANRDLITLDVAREGMVLMKNEGAILPLCKNAKVNIFGSGFAKFRLGASGAGRINPRYSIRLFDGIEMYSSLKINPELKNYYSVATDALPKEQILDTAEKWSDIALIALTRGTSENFDNLALPGEFYLTEDEENLIAEVSRRFNKTILLLNTGYPIDVRCAERYDIKAVLWTGLCGMNGGRAVAEILEGIINPSGKLPDTWTKTWEEIPSSKNFYQPASFHERINGSCKNYITTVYEEGLYVGYRYYDTFEKEAAYSFGSGLSYTNFNITYNVQNWIHPDTLDAVALTVTAKITNTGKVAGKETIQLYMGIPEGKLEQPKRRLVAFSKTKLLVPGETQKLVLTVTGRQIASFDIAQAAWITESGEWKLYAGSSLSDSKIIKTKYQTKEKLLLQSKNYMTPPEGFDFTTLSKKNPKETYPKGTLSGMTGVNYITPKYQQVIQNEKYPLTSISPENIITWENALKADKIPEEFVTQMTDFELARFCVCAKNGWGMEEKGEAGRIFVSSKYGTPEFAVADGNNGVNLVEKNIGFPTSVTVCATFNEKLAYAVGTAIAEEAKEKEIQMILAPAANLHRNPLGGRNAEYFSEDPFLAGRMCGQQSKGLEDHGIASNMKHILANNCESSRLRNNSIIDERTVRELYLKVFEEAFIVNKPASLMTSYNAINSIYGAEHAEMLQGIFIEEFGFDGFIMTDWTSIDTCDIIDAIAAGNGWITPGGMEDSLPNQIIEGIAQKRIDRKRIEKSVYRMMNIMKKYT